MSCFFCEDCQRRFFNLGWHAEACGSSNYQRIDDPVKYLPGNPDWEHDRAREDQVER